MTTKSYLHETFTLTSFETTRSFSDLAFRGCAFEMCESPGWLDPSNRGRLERISFESCTSRSCTLGPFLISQVSCDDCVSRNLRLIGAAFDRVRLVGKMGEVIVLPASPEVFGAARAKEMNEANQQFYGTVDWALDISGAVFSSLHCAGVPLHLIRRDEETQVIVERARLGGLELHAFREFEGEFGTVISNVMNYGPERALVVAPKARSRVFLEYMKGIDVLRRIGAVG